MDVEVYLVFLMLQLIAKEKYRLIDLRHYLLSKMFLVVISMLMLARSFNLIIEASSPILIATYLRTRACNFTANFNFEDSHSNTCFLVASMSLHYLMLNRETFFHKGDTEIFLGNFLVRGVWKSRRWLFVNEWITLEGMNMTLLSLYFESVDFDFRYGSKFAWASFTINPKTITFPLSV